MLRDASIDLKKGDTMFDLTPEERKVVIFLSLVISIGISISFLLKVNTKARDIAVFAQDLGKINLNQADKEMLMSVAGIGEKTALRVLEYRREHSVFSDIGELKNIKGLNNYRYDKIKDSFVIGK